MKLPFLQKKEPANEIEFQPSKPLTLGVEIELQMIDPTTGDLIPRAYELLKAAAHLPNVKPEFYLSTVEINTSICNSVQDVATDLQQTVDGLRAVAEPMGIAFSSTGVHPFAKYADVEISPTERYLDMIDRNQWMTRRMTVYGLHVHIGMASSDDCIRYNNFFMFFLPHLLALSASSPFWQGTDTGLSSCRPTTYEALPTAGQPYQVNSWNEFERLYESLKKCGSIRTLKDLWWDLRPSPGYGTLEIRVCDGCATMTETLAITAYIHLLAHWFADHGTWMETVVSPPRWLSRENKWRVIRYGLDAELVMNTDGKTKLLRDDIREWVEKLLPYAEKLEYQSYIDQLLTILENGTSSQRQRAVFQKTGSLQELVKFNIDEFSQGTPQWMVTS